MNHRHDRTYQPDKVGELPRWINRKIANIWRAITLGLIAKSNEFFCDGIQLWMGSKG